MQSGKKYCKRRRFYKNETYYEFNFETIKSLGSADKKLREDVKKEIKHFFISNWEDFGDTFLDHSLFNSTWIVIIRDEKEIIGIATVHKKKLLGKIFYNFKTCALIPKYHSLGLMEQMNRVLFTYAYIDNLLKQRSLWFHMIFTTSNLRILGFFAKHTKHIYPNPYLFDEKAQKIPLPDKKTWDYVKAYNRVDFPPDLPLTKEACVVDDSDSRWPHICYEKSGIPYHSDPLVNAFGDHYLRYKEGKQYMCVVCATVTPGDVIRYFLDFLKVRFHRLRKQKP